MNRMNKKLYLGAILASLAVLLLVVVLIAAFIIGLMTQKVDFRWFGLLLSLAIFGVLQWITVNLAVTISVIFQMWSSIDDGHARTTPGQAIGYLFIPFYNLYWIFQVWGGFPVDYNNYVKRYQLPVQQLSAGVYDAYPILAVLSIIPILGFIAAPVSFFVFLKIVGRTCNAVNELADAAQSRQKIIIPITLQNPTMAGV